MQGLSKEVCIKWCKDHEFTLSKHKRCFICVCLNRGVIVSAVGEKEFIKELCAKVPTSERHNVFITHTSELANNNLTPQNNLTPKEAHKIRKLIPEDAKKIQPGNPWGFKSVKKNNILIDFDNVIYPSKKWEGFDVLTEKPIPGSIEFLQMIANDFKIIITSVYASHPKGLQAMKDYLVLYGVQKQQVEKIKLSNKSHSKVKIKIENLKKWRGEFPSLNELHNI
ncbi:MAG TPA: hypothetical protein VMX17_09065 [Candidatus Glassbacteria bacterium]|nr:hypothetical protein [Candidatus Glassbacteria bacterium]